MAYRTPGFRPPRDGPWRGRMPIWGFSGQFLRGGGQSAHHAHSGTESGRVGHDAELDRPRRVNPCTGEIRKNSRLFGFREQGGAGASRALLRLRRSGALTHRAHAPRGCATTMRASSRQRQQRRAQRGIPCRARCGSGGWQVTGGHFGHCLRHRSDGGPDSCRCSVSSACLAPHARSAAPGLEHRHARSGLPGMERSVRHGARGRCAGPEPMRWAGGAGTMRAGWGGQSGISGGGAPSVLAGSCGGQPALFLGP